MHGLARLRRVFACAGVLSLSLLVGACDGEEIDLYGAEVVLDGAGDDDDDDANNGVRYEIDNEMDVLSMADFNQAASGKCNPDEGCEEPDPDPDYLITSCYCGQYGGSSLYVGVSCAGFPGTDVCCAVKCGELMDALDSQN